MTGSQPPWGKLRSSGRSADLLRVAVAGKVLRGESGRTYAQRVAEVPGLRVSDVVCTGGPGDAPFEERHAAVCVAVVLSGTFAYHGVLGRTLLTPGALLLGEHGRPFTCSHEHGEGDRCVAFHFTPDAFEGLAADVGIRRAGFGTHRLAPSRFTAPFVAAVECALAGGSAIEEAGYALAGFALRAGEDARPPEPTPRDERRAAEAIRLMETTFDQPHTLLSLAAQSGLSPYHFLRVIVRAAGATPHQLLLRLRLRAAARRLLGSGEAVTSVAHAVGFEDLSNFVRSFRAEFGVPPSRFRRTNGFHPGT